MSEALKEKAQFISDDIEIIGVFKTFIQSKEKVWVWQKNISKATGRRPVHLAFVKKIDPIKRVIEIRPTNKGGFKFDHGEEIFLYSATRYVAVKILVKSRELETLTFTIPDRLNILDQNFMMRVGILEKEDAEKFKHMRTIPRKEAKNNQMVTIKRMNGAEVRSHFLHDMSGGGMGFVVEDPGEYEIGESIEVENIDGKPLSRQVKGKVVAIRQMDDRELGQFKVGVRFET